MIAFVGSVFSPTYFAERSRRITPSPDAHCALNVALYGPPSRWTFTEHAAARVVRSSAAFSLGESTLFWDRGALVIELDERTPILGRRLRGRVRLRPEKLAVQSHALDPDARHLWWCLSPLATAIVEIDEPRVRFRGAGYLDANLGREPLDLGMRHWDWCRARAGGEAVVLYDAWPRRGDPVERAFLVDALGRREPIDGLVRQDLPRTGYRLSRSIRGDADARPQIVRELEDTPFYARALVRTRIAGREVVAVHESVSLDRFRRPIVQRMLPFRIRPRWRP